MTDPCCFEGQPPIGVECPRPTAAPDPFADDRRCAFRRTSVARGCRRALAEHEAGLPDLVPPAPADVSASEWAAGYRRGRTLVGDLPPPVDPNAVRCALPTPDEQKACASGALGDPEQADATLASHAAWARGRALHSFDQQESDGRALLGVGAVFGVVSALSAVVGIIGGILIAFGGDYCVGCLVAGIGAGVSAGCAILATPPLIAGSLIYSGAAHDRADLLGEGRADRSARAFTLSLRF